MIIPEEYTKIKDNFMRMKGKLDLLKENLSEQETTLEETKAKLESFTKARSVIQIVALNTQRNLEYHLSNLVTTAIWAINPAWPKFVVEISIQRNKTECNLFFEEFGVKQRPKNCSGGGVKDVASFALRIARWSLNKNRATFFLDEPFRNVSPDLQEKTSEMVKMTSEELKLQIIMISHQEDINIASDKTFHVTKEGQISKVEIQP